MAISLEVTITVDPSNVQTFLEHMRPAYETVIKEKECTFFEVVLNPQVPGEVHWVEGWTEGRQWLMDVCIFFSFLSLSLPFCSEK